MKRYLLALIAVFGMTAGLYGLETGQTLSLRNDSGVSVRVDTLGRYDMRYVLLYGLYERGYGMSVNAGVVEVEDITSAEYASVLDSMRMMAQGMTKEAYGQYFVQARSGLPQDVSDAVEESLKSDMAVTAIGDSLQSAIPFCTDSAYEFSAGTSGAAESGAYYDCLYTQPAPRWYYLRIAQAGNMTIHINSTPGSYDVDFCCWGPFTAQVVNAGQLTSNKVVDCSYSAAAQEDCTITGAQVGEYYVLLITNYSQQTTNIEFSKTPGSGTAETDCSIVQMVNLVVTTKPAGTGTTTGTGTYNGGRFVPCSVSPLGGCAFQYWEHLGQNISNSSSFTYTTSVSLPNDTLYAVMVNNSFFQTEMSVCRGDSVMFHGRYYSEEGVYYDSLKSVYGWDSVYELTLHVKETYRFETDTTVCVDDGCMFYGKKYTQTGTYYEYMRTVEGCDSIHELHLTAVDPTLAANVTDVWACQDDDDYVVDVGYSGSEPTKYSVKYDGTAIPSTNDVIEQPYDGQAIVMPIPVNADGTRVRPDRYSVTVELGNDLCGMRQVGESFVLNIDYSKDVLLQHFNDVVSVLNHKYNGGFYFDGFVWYLNGYELPNVTGSNLYDTSMKAGDVVYAKLRRQGENYYIPTCELPIVNLGADDREYPIEVEKTWIRRSEGGVTVRAGEEATFWLSTMGGELLKEGRMESGVEMRIEVPCVAGCYLLMVDAETAGRRVFKIVVE